MSLFELLDIHLVEYINNYLELPDDSINFIKVIDKYFRCKQNYVNPIIYNMITSSNNKMSDYYKSKLVSVHNIHKMIKANEL